MADSDEDSFDFDAPVDPSEFEGEAEADDADDDGFYGSWLESELEKKKEGLWARARKKSEMVQGLRGRHQIRIVRFAQIALRPIQWEKAEK